MNRTVASFVFAVAATLAGYACSSSQPASGGSNNAANNSSSGGASAGPGTGAACAATACGGCIGEAGCWWHLDTNRCTQGNDGCNGTTNCTNGNDTQCPAP